MWKDKWRQEDVKIGVEVTVIVNVLNSRVSVFYLENVKENRVNLLWKNRAFAQYKKGSRRC